MSTSAPSSASEEIAEMNRKLKRYEKDLKLMNKRIEQSHGRIHNIIKLTLGEDSLVK